MRELDFTLTKNIDLIKSYPISKNTTKYTQYDILLAAPENNVLLQEPYKNGAKFGISVFEPSNEGIVSTILITHMLSNYIGFKDPVILKCLKNVEMFNNFINHNLMGYGRITMRDDKVMYNALMIVPTIFNTEQSMQLLEGYVNYFTINHALTGITMAMEDMSAYDSIPTINTTSVTQ